MSFPAPPAGPGALGPLTSEARPTGPSRGVRVRWQAVGSGGSVVNRDHCSGLAAPMRWDAGPGIRLHLVQFLWKIS